ncbi:MAG: hypothetical protein HY776_08070, partial [Actinobacteria bacterium]|nr:hypothetical protein [Actinomycetota bacterium]
MGYKSRTFFLTCLGLVAFFVFSFFTSYGYAVETQITTNSASQINPSISGNYIVWEDYRNSPSYDPLKNPDIYGVDISNLGNEIAIASEGVFDNSTY